MRPAILAQRQSLTAMMWLGLVAKGLPRESARLAVRVAPIAVIPNPRLAFCSGGPANRTDQTFIVSE